MAQARQTPQRNEHERRDQDADERRGQEGAVHLDPRRAHLGVEVDARPDRDGEAEHDRAERVDRRLREHDGADEAARVTERLQRREVPVVVEHGEVHAGQDHEHPHEDADPGRHVEHHDHDGQHLPDLRQEIPLGQHLADEVHVVERGTGVGIHHRIDVRARSLARELADLLGNGEGHQGQSAHGRPRETDETDGERLVHGVHLEHLTHGQVQALAQVSAQHRLALGPRTKPPPLAEPAALRHHQHAQLGPRDEAQDVGVLDPVARAQLHVTAEVGLRLSHRRVRSQLFDALDRDRIEKVDRQVPLVVREPAAERRVQRPDAEAIGRRHAQAQGDGGQRHPAPEGLPRQVAHRVAVSRRQLADGMRDTAT